MTPKARKGVVSAIEGRGLIAAAPIAAGELIAIKGGHIVTTGALESAAGAGARHGGRHRDAGIAWPAGAGQDPGQIMVLAG
jgi:hypothetical protein